MKKDYLVHGGKLVTDLLNAYLIMYLDTVGMGGEDATFKHQYTKSSVDHIFSLKAVIEM